MNIPDTIRSIGILAPNKRYLGANIMLVPFLKTLKRIFPDAEITLISPKKQAEITLRLGLADKLWVNDDSRLSAFLKTARDIRKKKFDILFTLRRKSERDWMLNMLSRAGFKVGFRRSWSPLVYDRCFVYDKQHYRASNFLKLLSPFKDEDNDYGLLFHDYECSTEPAVWLIPCSGEEESLARALALAFSRFFCFFKVLADVDFDDFRFSVSVGGVSSGVLCGV